MLVARFAYGKWRIEERSTSKSFSQEGLYYSLSGGRTAQWDDIVERELSKIEDKVARCWKHLRRQLDRGAEPRCDRSRMPLVVDGFTSGCSTLGPLSSWNLSATRFNTANESLRRP